MCVCVCVCVCLNNSSARAGCNTISVSKMELNRFKFGVYLLLNGLPYQFPRDSEPNYLPIARK